MYSLGGVDAPACSFHFQSAGLMITHFQSRGTSALLTAAASRRAANPFLLFLLPIDANFPCSSSLCTHFRGCHLGTIPLSSLARIVECYILGSTVDSSFTLSCHNSADIYYRRSYQLAPVGSLKDSTSSRHRPTAGLCLDLHCPSFRT